MPNTTEMVMLEVNGRETSAFLALPEGIGPWPGVVVIQEWWGLEEHIKDVAQRFATEGFVAIAPDLYYGEVTTEPDEARKLLMALDWENALSAIQGAIDTLLARKDVLPKKVGVIGFCMGGGLTWHAAAKLNSVAVAAPFYGGGPEMTDDEVARIDAAILAIFGELDQGVSPEVANARAAQMDKAGIAHETIIYPDAQHAFFNDRRAAYHPEAAADAWQRVLALFKTQLIGDGGASNQSSPKDAWSDVGRQFRALGESLVSALSTTLQGEDTQQVVAGVQASFDSMVNQVSQATKKMADSDELRKVQTEVEKTARSAQEASKKSVEEVRPYLLDAFHKLRSELDNIINRMEQDSAAEEGESDSSGSKA